MTVIATYTHALMEDLSLILCTDKVDFIRDVIAFMVVIGTVIAVALDGVVCLTVQSMVYVT